MSRLVQRLFLPYCFTAGPNCVRCVDLGDTVEHAKEGKVIKHDHENAKHVRSYVSGFAMFFAVLTIRRVTRTFERHTSYSNLSKRKRRTKIITWNFFMSRLY